jgi:hypothetical protein
MAEKKRNTLFSWMTRLFRKLARRDDPQPPGYPYSDKLVPINRGPRKGSGAIALEEPLPPTNTDAKGRAR